MSPGLIFVILAAVAEGFWTVFHQRATNHINALFGAILVSLTAVIIGSLVLLPKFRTTQLFTNPKGVIFVIGAGVCALAIDFFALKAYRTGMPISIAGTIIIGGGIAIASTIGFIFGEAITLQKLIGVSLVIAGSVVLSLATK